MNNLTAFLISLAVALPIAAVTYLWERRRLARPGGPYAKADFSGLILLLALAAAWWPHLQSQPRLFILLLGGLVIFLIAAIVDIRGWPQAVQILGIIAVAALISHQGISVTTVKLPFTTTFVSLGWWGPILTVVWVVICAVLFGRAASILAVPLGVGALAAAALFVVCLLEPAITSPLAPFVALTLCGACLPQVPFARLLSYGEASAGAYIVGYFIGALSVLGALKNTAFLVALLPLIIVGVPLFAATFTYATDLRRGWRALAVAEQRQHLHQLLLSQGYNHRQVIGILLAGTAYLCLVAILLVVLIEVTFVLKALLLIVAGAGGLLIFYIALRLLPRSGTDQIRPEPSEVRLLGVRLHAVDLNEALGEVERFISEERPHMIVTLDASGVMRAREDEELHRIMEEADLVAPDGAGVVLAARMLNLPLDVRCAGCDMIVDLCRVAARLGRSVYLLGAEPGVAQAAADRLTQQIPGLEIAGCHHGYFSVDEEPQIVEEIKQTRPGVLLVALGIPKQEKWIKKHLQALKVPVCIGVGGALDIISGRKKRAPVWMQRAGLEWLYRTIKEPRRLPRLVALPKIVWMTVQELLCRDIPSRRSSDND